MATIAIFHSVLGLRSIEASTVARFQGRGHTAIAPDLFDGLTATTVEEGFAIMEQVGWTVICDRARAALDQMPKTTVLVGFSMGAGVISALWPVRRRAAGVVLLHGLANVPAEVDTRTPIQLHLANPDAFSPPAQTQEWISNTGRARLSADVFLYPALGHFFSDPSLDDFNADGAAQMWDRVDQLLDVVDRRPAGGIDA